MTFDTRIISVRVAAAALVAIVVVVADLAPGAALVLAVVAAVVAIDTLVELVVRQRSTPPLVQPIFAAAPPTPDGGGFGNDGWREAPAPAATSSSPSAGTGTGSPTLVAEEQSPQGHLPSPNKSAVASGALFEAARYLARQRGEREVQCPRCGRFDVETQRVGAASAHQCRVCQHSWSWTTGTPWPATRPVADLRVLGMGREGGVSNDGERGESRHEH